MLINSLVGKSVRVELYNPIKTHIGQKRVLYGHLTAVTKLFIQLEIGYVTAPKLHKKQVQMISKDLIKSISKDWLDIVEKGNKEWYKPTTAWIPARDG